MKKLFSIIALALLTSCGPTPSYLAGQQDVSFPNAINAVLIFDYSGTFTYTQSYYPPCNQAGTWTDLNTGSTIGTVRIHYTIDTCCTPSLVGTTANYAYAVSQGNLIVNYTFN